MHLATITAVRAELEAELVGRRFGKVIQLSKFDVAVDFRLTDSRYLFISIEPGNPRIYLIRRRLRDLERLATNPTPFSLALRKRLSNATLAEIRQVENERVLLLGFDAVDDLDQPDVCTLAVQLTGKSANLLLLNSGSSIVATAKETQGSGQQIGDRYSPPSRMAPAGAAANRIEPPTVKTGTSISETLDIAGQEQAAEKRFQSLAGSARSNINREIAKRQRLVERLNNDRDSHGDADRWKRLGDLLLANVATARREEGAIIVTDYFDEAAPEIAIEADENDSVTDAAEKLFRKYTKARNARGEIETRLRDLEAELKSLAAKTDRVEKAIVERDEAALGELSGVKKVSTKTASKPSESPSGVRRFVSSDGLEILVGKKAKDNDFLTFRIAKSLDTWMHAADYPGSHVVIRNPNRKDVPHRTLIEAAQLAAFYSQGKTQPKAAVHYTQKKFVNKPKGSAPGLVSLASFKTILVEPKIGDVRKVNGEW